MNEKKTKLMEINMNTNKLIKRNNVITEKVNTLNIWVY